MSQVGLQLRAAKEERRGLLEPGQHRLCVSLVLHPSFPKKGMSFPLHSKSTWLNAVFGRWDPSLGNKGPASAFAVFSRKGN